jgi:hypothetical protein
MGGDPSRYRSSYVVHDSQSDIFVCRRAIRFVKDLAGRTKI